MLSYQDCLALSDLTDQEIAAIAEHEHVPMIVALELGNYLVSQPDGVPKLKRIILDDIAAATGRGDTKRAGDLRLVLRHFVQTHPRHRPNAA